MRTPRVLILIGLPGSGKSTWAAQQKRAVTLSSDQLRHVLSGDETNQQIHGRVFAAMRYLLRERLRLQQHLTIIDATNLRRKDRKPFLKIAAAFGARAEAVLFDVPPGIARQRNAARRRRVPSAVIAAMALRLQLPSRAEGFARIRKINASGASTKAKAQ